jgi:dATP pyrophosphohydrolase
VARAPFQILVFPYTIDKNGVEYAIFRRSDDDSWQGIAGGGEDNETPEMAARRECMEEAAIPDGSDFIRLQTTSSIPVSVFRDSFHWRNDLYVIPEYCFGVCMKDPKILISVEHKEVKWCKYDVAYSLLRYDGNKTALWELNKRIAKM